MINKRYLKILIIILITNFLIFILNTSVYPQDLNFSCDNPSSCVLLNGEQLFEITEQAGGYTPEKRAKKISEKLVSKANDMSININQFSVISRDSTSAVVAIIQNGKEEDIVTVTPQDAKQAKAKTSLDLADKYNKIIQKAITKYRDTYYRNSIKGNRLCTFMLVLLCVLIIFREEIYVFIIQGRFSDFRVWLSRQIRNLLQKGNQEGNQDNFELKDTRLTFDKISEKFKNYQIDESLGEVIEYIYAINANYVIFRTRTGIRAYINENYNSDKGEDKIMIKRYREIQDELALIDSQQPHNLNRTKSINPLIAKGIELALTQEDLTSAKTTFKKAQKRLKKFNEENSIFEYLKGSFFTLCNFIIVILLLNIMPILWPDIFNNIFDLLNIPKEVSIVILFGTLGGFLSVLYGIMTRKIDIDFGSNIERFAASRIYIAVISSLIVYSALKANIADLSVLITKDNTEISVFKIAFISAVSGFAERLVPDLLTKQAGAKSNSA